MDVNQDSRSDVLLVGAPMFMNDLKREVGRVYMFSVSKVKQTVLKMCYLNAHTVFNNAGFQSILHAHLSSQCLTMHGFNLYCMPISVVWG